ncbi:peptidase U32 [Virgibacillus pantothenticus]|uniref:Peptidase U32 n=1 Tax=Virgibacillus pantothenticus TaxID=1473 RepID=A0A0L0QU98_VIRPA|nr:MULTISPECIES: peptidase U32 family protein [Virgibacillus]API90963.1 peptidase U32 [Virgibacillus sp. 6R]KNE22077.1 peptidase U32 [Virgibacillus pantothenticus]MBS7428943.1 U32 family peptidase [Virgibacillus sp. 19R1-5]MBU8566696.1 U32 family peptidase [Virgibacillus pantothenticus]MBU8600279.1 U32 family peptidase [Virgibacillus pantothenticus]
MVELIATAESINQAKLLIDADVDTLYIGEATFGLRLPANFSPEEIKEICHIAHAKHKKVCVAMNAIIHNDRVKLIPGYFDFLQEAGADYVTIGDPGIIHLLNKHEVSIPYVYDPHTMVTSAKQVNFWAKRGAKGAVLARELTYEELISISEHADVPVEVLVYGATCIHHSKRPLVTNYFSYTNEKSKNQEHLFISEPKKPETHYSIYEDMNGTHIFDTNDINLLPHLKKLVDAGISKWKLDGIYTQGRAFVEVAKQFVQAKQALLDKGWSDELKEKLNLKVKEHHPSERTLGEGFFLKNPNDVQ